MGFWASCEKHYQHEHEVAKEGVVPLERVREETQETLKDTMDYTDQQKEAYQRLMESKLREYDNIASELNAKSAGFKEEDRVKYIDKRGEFEQKKNAAYEKLRELKVGSSKSWKDVKTQLDGSMADLALYYDKEFSQFR